MNRAIHFATIVLLAMSTCMFGYSQSTVYSFTVTTDTVVEHNAILVLGYVKADTAPVVADSVVIVLQSGFAHASHVDTASSFVIRFAAGQDSVPFYIYILDDTIPEYTEQLTYVLRNYGSNAGIGIDSVFNFVLKDNDLPASIGYTKDTVTAWEHDGHVPVYIQVNNPNLFYIRYETGFYDQNSNNTLHPSNCAEAVHFYYNPEVFYAPPGISTQIKYVDIVNDNLQNPDRYFYCLVFNLDANIIVDSFVKFIILDDDYHHAPKVSFDTNRKEVRRDTVQRVTFPITVDNPNWSPLIFTIDTFLPISNYNHSSLIVPTPYFNYGHGLWHDSVVVFITNDHWVQDTQVAVFRIKGIPDNTSIDTLFNLVLTSPDSLYISFKGAARSHPKSDSIGYVYVYTSGAVKYPVTADVKYLNGNATPGVDFIFRDTSVLFRANLFDTVAVPVRMLKDHLHQGNEQVNLQLLHTNPASVIPLIIQYTYMIIDDDSTALWAGINSIEDGAARFAMSNPFTDYIHIKTGVALYDVVLSTMMGTIVAQHKDSMKDSSIPTAGLPTGMYLLTLTADGYSYTTKVIKSN